MQCDPVALSRPPRFACSIGGCLLFTHERIFIHASASLLILLPLVHHPDPLLSLSHSRRESNIFLSLSAVTSTLVRSISRTTHLDRSSDASSPFSPSGKSTTTGRLIFELGGIPERELEKLKAEADALGKSSFAFAFYMDTQKEERARGVTISCTTKEFFTEKWHYTIIDAPGESLVHLIFLPPSCPLTLCCPPLSLSLLLRPS